MFLQLLNPLKNPTQTNEQQNPQNFSFLMGRSIDPIKCTILLADPTHHPKWQLNCFTWFYRAIPQILHSLQWITHYAPPKLPLSMERLGPPFNTFFSGPTQPTTPNGISVASAILPKYTLVSSRQDRKTDRQNKHGTRPIPIADNAAMWLIMLR